MFLFLLPPIIIIHYIFVLINNKLIFLRSVLLTLAGRQQIISLSFFWPQSFIIPLLFSLSQPRRTRVIKHLIESWQRQAHNFSKALKTDRHILPSLKEITIFFITALQWDFFRSISTIHVSEISCQEVPFEDTAMIRAGVF